MCLRPGTRPWQRHRKRSTNFLYIWGLKAKNVIITTHVLFWELHTGKYEASMNIKNTVIVCNALTIRHITLDCLSNVDWSVHMCVYKWYSLFKKKKKNMKRREGLHRKLSDEFQTFFLVSTMNIRRCILYPVIWYSLMERAWTTFTSYRWTLTSVITFLGLVYQ